MTKLPDEVMNIIYNYEHQLRHWDVMRELLMHKINCVFNVQFSQAFRMKYRHPDGSLRPCITVDRIGVIISIVTENTRKKMTYLTCYFL